MRTRLAVTVLIAASLAPIGAMAPPALAASYDTTIGGCEFDTNSVQAVTGSSQAGFVYDVSVTHDPAGGLIGATVSCKLQADGVDIPGTTFSYLGYGEQAGADPVSFDVGDAAVGLCQRTVYADGTDTGWYCYPTSMELPPSQIPPPVLELLAVVNEVFVWDIDPRLCPVLAAHSGTYGPVVVHPDGDVYVADPLNLGMNPVDDCPPYGNF